MAQHYFSLTKNEWEIMEVMWKAGRPLSRAEVIALSEDRTWRASSFHVLMNSLLEKGAVKVVGFVLNTKKYARTFAPAISEVEYAAMQVKSMPSYTPKFIPALVSTLMPESDNEEILEELKARLKAVEEKEQPHDEGEC